MDVASYHSGDRGGDQLITPARVINEREEETLETPPPRRA